MTPPLLVFDSGIGGLSILKELIHYHVPLSYFADSAYFPYGDRTQISVAARLKYLAHSWAKQPYLGVVIACNTATVTTLSTLRSILPFPVFGVEPVTKMLKHHSYPVIWGTKLTTHSHSVGIHKILHGSHIRYYTPVGLAVAIENNDQLQIKQILNRACTELGYLDAIGLSCTHYPLIKSQIQDVFPRAVLYDPSSFVAAHVANTLALLPATTSAPSITYSSSGSVLRLVKRAREYGL